MSGDELPLILPSDYQVRTDPLDDEQQYTDNPFDNPVEQMGMQADGRDNIRGQNGPDEYVHNNEDVHTRLGQAVSEDEYEHAPVRKRMHTDNIPLGSSKGTNIIARPAGSIATPVRRDSRVRTTILYNPATPDPLSGGNVPGVAWIGFTRDQAFAGAGGFPLPPGQSLALDYNGPLAVAADPSGATTVVYVIRLLDEL